MSILSQISRYRELEQRCQTGDSLSLRETLALEALGTALRRQSTELLTSRMRAVLSTNTVERSVVVKRLGPHMVVCTGCPEHLPRKGFGLRLDDENEQQSYLFRVMVSSIADATTDGQPEVAFEFVGRPVVLRWGRGRSNSPEAVVKLEQQLRAA